MFDRLKRFRPIATRYDETAPSHLGFLAIGLAYVLVPRTFSYIQDELDRSLAPFKREGETDFPIEALAFDD